MQTSVISVMSTVDGLSHMDDIKQYIQSRCDTMSVVNLSTAITDDSGRYDDVVITRVAPVMFCDEPVIALPRGLEALIRAKGFHLFCLFVVLIAALSFPLTLLLPASLRLPVFVASTSLQAIMYTVHFLMFRWRVFLLVLKTFEFWYLLLFEAAACTCGAFIYVSAGVSIPVVAVCMFFYSVTHSIFAFGIDASPWSPSIRAWFMIFWFATYAMIAVAARLAEYIFEPTVYQDFVSFQVNFFVVSMTPRSGMISTILTLLAFYARYAVLMFTGSEYCLIAFAASNARRSGGVITVKTEDLDDNNPAGNSDDDEENDDDDEEVSSSVGSWPQHGNAAAVGSAASLFNPFTISSDSDVMSPTDVGSGGRTKGGSSAFAPPPPHPPPPIHQTTSSAMPQRMPRVLFSFTHHDHPALAANDKPHHKAGAAAGPKPPGDGGAPSPGHPKIKRRMTNVTLEGPVARPPPPSARRGDDVTPFDALAGSGSNVFQVKKSRRSVVRIASDKMLKDRTAAGGGSSSVDGAAARRPVVGVIRGGGEGGRLWRMQSVSNLDDLRGV